MFEGITTPLPGQIQSQSCCHREMVHTMFCISFSWSTFHDRLEKVNKISEANHNPPKVHNHPSDDAMSSFWKGDTDLLRESQYHLKLTLHCSCGPMDCFSY